MSLGSHANLKLCPNNLPHTGQLYHDLQSTRRSSTSHICRYGMLCNRCHTDPTLAERMCARALSSDISHSPNMNCSSIGSCRAYQSGICLSLKIYHGIIYHEMGSDLSDACKLGPFSVVYPSEVQNRQRITPRENHIDQVFHLNKYEDRSSPSWCFNLI